jgi:tetratricopeptide (TPR) repeat protein
MAAASPTKPRPFVVLMIPGERSLAKWGPIPLLCAIGTGWNWGAFDRAAEIHRRYQPQLPALPRPEIVRSGSLGYRSVLADLYWIGAVNYFGDQRNAHFAYAELPNYLELVIALDPDFRYPYLFAGYALPWNKGHGWVNVDSAISIMERGVHRFPNDWQLRIQLAYLYSGYQHQYREAGDQLAAAARLPGAPPYAGRLATRMYASTGNYDGALAIADEILGAEEDEDIRREMTRRKAEILVVRDLDRLERLINDFKRIENRFPTRLEELVSAGMIDALPRESLGGVFEYDAVTGTVQSSVLHDRLKVFEQP